MTSPSKEEQTEDKPSSPTNEDKRKREDEEEPNAKEEEEEEADPKKQKTEEFKPEAEEKAGPPPAPVHASSEGISFFIDADVLSGRGGGTNVHPGNRNFRDLINLHRRAYLKARKNDKPAISRAIVSAIRENNGRFLKKDEKTGLWYEIGDDAAREKTSQALRQRAPEMRKLLFDTEREEARAAAEEHLRQQRMFMGMGAGNSSEMMQGMPPPGMFNPAMFAQMAGGKNGVPPGGPDAYSHMFGFLGQGMNQRLPTSNPAPAAAASTASPSKKNPTTNNDGNGNNTDGT